MDLIKIKGLWIFPEIRIINNRFMLILWKWSRNKKSLFYNKGFNQGKDLINFKFGK